MRVIGIHSALVVAIALLSPTLVAESVSFEREVWPILAERCIQCHGTAKVEGELRLDTPEGVRVGGELGVVINDAKPASSALLELISLPADDSDLMPAKGDPLSSNEIDILTRWIMEGATFDGWTPAMADAANTSAEKYWADKKQVVIEFPATFAVAVDKVEFNEHIRPILSDNCFKCHGPDRAALKADLRLDLEDDALRERDGVTPIIPGNARTSELVRRIFHPDSEEMMPPHNSGKSLTDAEKNLLAAWIDQNAAYEKHWAYELPKRPKIAQARQDNWSRNVIDTLLLQGMHEHDLKPSPAADAVTLVRRLYNDLTGLPPTPEVVDAFAANPTDRAYENLVDDLLASPRYGERMSINWLDQVRYADSNGYHSDEERSIYPYRDYVIDSFNANKPFDEFTIEQLAGDLLDNPTRDQLVATGFNRLNQITAEGGAQAKEYRTKYNADRVRALGSVWMGATLGCVECHEHKFDPYRPEDFYEFAAFFSDVTEEDVFPGGTDWAPVLAVPDEEQMNALTDIEGRISILERLLANPTRTTKKAASAWFASLNDQADSLAQGWLPVQVTSAESANGATLEVLDDLTVLASGLEPEQDVYTFTFTTHQKKLTALRFDALSHTSFKFSLARHRKVNQMNEFEVFVQSADMDTPVQVSITDGALNYGENNRSFLEAVDGNLDTSWDRGGAKEENARNPISFMFKFEKPVKAGPDTQVTIKIHYLGELRSDRSAFGRSRISITTDKEPTLDAASGVPAVLVEAALAGPRLTRQERATAEHYYTSITEDFSEDRTALDAAQDELLALKKQFPTTLVTRSRVFPRETRMLPRGNWLDESGAIVEPAVPDFLPPLKNTGKRPTRLDLAEWLVAEENPLTARVFVNRLWKLYFGKGISVVLDDLGSQGEPPVHPELLDWLAVEFVESGWDVKHMVRLIVSSSAYRQRSDLTVDLFERDPENRLIARQSAFRYEAEMVRDTALALGGLLNPEIGGPSVRPYQPEGYWEHLNFPKRTYAHDENKSQYRRGLYVHWQRSFLHPSMKAFDAPSREECTAERPISNTPLQALTLLNDPTYVEASRAFAERILNEGGATANEKITWALRQAILRAPDDNEVSVLSELYENHLNDYTANPDSVDALLSVGMRPAAENIDATELAAWVSVARVILNLHETITRG